MKTLKPLSYVAKLGCALFAASYGTISFWLKQHDAGFGQQPTDDKADEKHFMPPPRLNSSPRD